MIKILEAKVGRFLLGCKCPLIRGIVVQEQDPFGDLPALINFALITTYLNKLTVGHSIEQLWPYGHDLGAEFWHAK